MKSPRKPHYLFQFKENPSTMNHQISRRLMQGPQVATQGASQILSKVQGHLGKASKR
jgi:hypothetical protein